ncbi:GGDEF domain-containing protein [Mycolicibacterium litorale]|uniref:GGDEF domain-containing protein n=1 Tax=Mycolicibacterium litorale TaxID=758802 RepID=UPI0039A09A99
MRSLAGAEGPVLGRQRVRLLRIYLGATTFLYLYGVVFTFFPVRTDLVYANPTGGVVAIVLGVAALGYLAVRPQRLWPATVAAMAAAPIVMAFHVTLTAQYVCMIAPMFLAMYLRAFHPPRQAWPLIGVQTAACVAAVAVSPAHHTGVITFLIITVAIVGAAESFGMLMRAMFTEACTDPLTGLLNRAGWEIGTADLLAGRRSGSATVSVVALDIDGLKTLNDTYGHLAGDRHIAGYARQWRRLAPRGTVLARLGGDEFGACIAGTDPDALTGFVRDIRHHTPGVSVGTATAPCRDADIAGLYAQADAAMYRSRGRPVRDAGPR